MKLNVGCGSDIRPGWVNLDIVSGSGVDVVADCCVLPYQEDEVQEIAASHLVEHLSKPELGRFASECWRVLAPGGKLEVVAPDLEQVVAAYWLRRDQESIDLEDFPIAPVDWLDNLLFSRHLHETDFHKQGIYERKLRDVFARFALHQFARRDKPRSRWEIVMTCRKDADVRCSIVMSTRNKADALERTLASIRTQRVPFPYEIVVVDDGSTDRTPEVCRTHNVRYFHLDNDRYRNPSKARNVGYRAARGEIIISQSDDVVHVSRDAVERLVSDLEPGRFLLAKVDNYRYAGNRPSRFVMNYCGPSNKRPYFFLGSIRRADLYAVGGCDEDFVEPCFDDNWLADCLMRGLKLRPQYSDRIYARHQKHSYADGSHDKENESKKLYFEKFCQAEATGKFESGGGPWPLDSEPPAESIPVMATVAPTLADTPHVPKTMSFFWAGGKLSWMRYMTLHSFRRFHPDWRVRLFVSPAAGRKSWKSHEVQDSDFYRGHDYLAEVPALGVEIVPWNAANDDLAPAHASDLFQWEALATDGGFYSDMDILYTGRIPHETLCDADAIVCFPRGFVAIGFCGATPATTLFENVLKSARENYSESRYQSTGAEALYQLGRVGPNWHHQNHPGNTVLANLRADYQDLTIAALPAISVYPMDWKQMSQIFSEAHPLPSGSFGLHWYGGNPVAQQWNAKLTHANVAEFDSTWTRAAALSLQEDDVAIA